MKWSQPRFNSLKFSHFRSWWSSWSLISIVELIYYMISGLFGSKLSKTASGVTQVAPFRSEQQYSNSDIIQALNELTKSFHNNNMKVEERFTKLEDKMNMFYQTMEINEAKHKMVISDEKSKNSELKNATLEGIDLDLEDFCEQFI